MSTPFAALEDRVNAVVSARLANAEVDFGDGPEPCIFDDAYSLASAGAMGVSNSTPCLSILSASVPSDVVNKDVAVTRRGGTENFRVTEERPDGAGMTELMLERLA